MSSINPRDFLKSHNHEGMKFYITYDGSNRMEYCYEATASAIHGSPCLVTQYAYDAASTRVQKMKEYQAAWDSTWDLP